MKKIFCVLLIVCGCVYADTRDQLAILKHDIERIIHRSDKTATVGIDIVSMNTGKRLYSRNQDQRFIPASVTKVLMLGAALECLGVDYTFETGIYTDGKVEGDVLFGNVYIKGGGDPGLEPLDLQDLAKQLHVMGIQEIRGSIVTDTSWFDSMDKASGWMWEDAQTTWNGVVSALTVNNSCVDLWIRPGKHDATPAIVMSDIPMLELPFSLDNQILTLTSVKETAIDIYPQERDNKSVLQVTGNIATHAMAQKRRIPVQQPAQLAGAMFKAALCQYGITSIGSMHEGVVPADATKLTSHRSLPLSIISQKMMKNSDNLYAHLVLKTLGAEAKGPPGTWPAGSQAVRQFLAEKVRLDVSNLVFVDASGLSRYNLISPSQVVEYLDWIHHHSLYRHEFKSALAIAGVDGTLKNRMQDIRGRLRGKTGTMTGVSSLCGYVTTEDNEELAFAIMVNGTVKKQAEIRSSLIDPICIALSNFSSR